MFNKDLKASLLKLFFSFPLQKFVAIGVIILNRSSSSCFYSSVSYETVSEAISKGLEIDLMRDKLLVSSSDLSRNFSSSESTAEPNSLF